MYTYRGLYRAINEAMDSKYKKTQKKEAIGKQLLLDSNLLNKWFKNNKGYEWIEDKETQLSGVDYMLKSQHDNDVAIDLKCCIGPDYERIPVEYDQYTEMNGCWEKTITEKKRTDFLLYVNVSINTETVYFVIVDYKFMVQEMNKIERGEKTIFDSTIPKESFNGTGHYFTISMDKCKECRSMYVEEMKFQALTKIGRVSKNPLEKILEEL